VIYNNRNLTINDYLVRNFINIETNQNTTKSTFASNYLMELINKYIDVLKRNKDIIDKVRRRLNSVGAWCLYERLYGEDNRRNGRIRN